MAGERPVIPAAEFLKDTFSGLADGISGLGDSFANNDALDVILRRHLESKNMNMSGFSVRHYDRSGSIEYKLKGHSVEQGLADDVLYYSKHDELIQWAAENRPELIPASLMPSAAPSAAAAPSVGTPSVAVDSPVPGYQTTDDLIKDFTTKASSPQADEAGAILKDVFDKTDFANKEFDIPGSTRSITGSDVLGKLSGIEMTDQIGSVAAYHPESGRMLVNQNLLKQLQPEEIATTFTHELFHTAADVSGSLDAERLTRATSAGSAMTLEDAKYIGQQEGIADSFSRRTNARSWL